MVRGRGRSPVQPTPSSSHQLPPTPCKFRFCSHKELIGGSTSRYSHQPIRAGVHAAENSPKRCNGERSVPCRGDRWPRLPGTDSISKQPCQETRKKFNSRKPEMSIMVGIMASLHSSFPQPTPAKVQIYIFFRCLCRGLFSWQHQPQISSPSGLEIWRCRLGIEATKTNQSKTTPDRQPRE